MDVCKVQKYLRYGASIVRDHHKIAREIQERRYIIESVVTLSRLVLNLSPLVWFFAETSIY